MPTGRRSFVSRLPGGSLALIFGLGIFLPGAVLATLGVRALFQERQLADQETRSRLERIATLAADDVGREIQAWQLAIDRVTQTDPVDPSPLPEPIRRAVAAPGIAVIVTGFAGRLRAWPESALAYRLGDHLPAPALRPRAYDDAAAIGTIARDPDRAIVAYERLLPSARGADRAWLLHRLTVALRKTGRSERAVGVLDALERLVADVSAEFLARYERCEGYAHRQRTDMLAPAALALHRDLVTRRMIGSCGTLTSMNWHSFERLTRAVRTPC